MQAVRRSEVFLYAFIITAAMFFISAVGYHMHPSEQIAGIFREICRAMWTMSLITSLVFSAHLALNA